MLSLQASDFGQVPPTVAVVLNSKSWQIAKAIVHSMKEQSGCDLLYNAALCLLYMLFGPSLMIINKEILSDKIGFPYPLLLSSIGMLTASVVAFASAGLGLFKPRQQKVLSGFFFKNVVPQAFFHALTCATGNAQYLYMGVAMVQFLKALSPVIVAMTSLVLLKKGEQPIVWAFLVGLSCSTCLTVSGDVRTSSYGLLLAFVSSLSEALRLVMAQSLLQECKFSVMESLYYVMPVAALCLLLFGSIWELPACLAAGSFSAVHEYPLYFGAASVAGLAIQVSTPVVIQAVGSVTLKSMGQVRNAAVVLIGVFLYGEKVGGRQFFGYALSVLFFGLYTRSKGLGAPMKTKNSEQLQSDTRNTPKRVICVDDDGACKVAGR